jgi:hypothetical protein
MAAPNKATSLEDVSDNILEKIQEGYHELRVYNEFFKHLAGAEIDQRNTLMKLNKSFPPNKEQWSLGAGLLELQQLLSELAHEHEILAGDINRDVADPLLAVKANTSKSRHKLVSESHKQTEHLRSASTKVTKSQQAYEQASGKAVTAKNEVLMDQEKNYADAEKTNSKAIEAKRRFEDDSSHHSFKMLEYRDKHIPGLVKSFEELEGQRIGALQQAIISLLQAYKRSILEIERKVDAALTKASEINPSQDCAMYLQPVHAVVATVPATL